MRVVVLLALAIAVSADIDWSPANNDPYGYSRRQNQGSTAVYVDGNGQKQNGSPQAKSRAPASKQTFATTASLNEQLKTWYAEPMNPPSYLQYVPSQASEFGVEIYHVTNGWTVVQGMGAFSMVEANDKTVVMCRLGFARGSTPSVQQANNDIRNGGRMRTRKGYPAATDAAVYATAVPAGVSDAASAALPPASPGHFSFYSRSSESQRAVETTVAAYVAEQQAIAAELSKNSKAMETAEKGGNTTLIGMLFLERKRLKEKQEKKYTLPNVLNTDMIVVKDCLETNYGFVRIGANIFYITRPLVNIEAMPLFARAAVYPNVLDDGGWTKKQQALLDSVLPQEQSAASSQATASSNAAQNQPSQYVLDPLDRFDANAAATRFGYGYDYGRGNQPQRAVLAVSD